MKIFVIFMGLILASINCLWVPSPQSKSMTSANALRAIGALTDLKECIDYSLEENINTVSTPSLEILSLITLEI